MGTHLLGLRTVGRTAVLVDVVDASRARGLAQWARARGLPVEEIVPGACTVLFDGCADPVALAQELEAWPGLPDVRAGSPVELPVVYDGPDLDYAAHAWGMTRREAAATHAACEFTVAFCGFAPGFAYLDGLPRELALPRLATPRAAVPAGSVAVADAWTGVYPTGSPGGWRLLGRTRARLWRPEDEAAPALLAPGTRVRLVVTP